MNHSFFLQNQKGRQFFLFTCLAATALAWPGFSDAREDASQPDSFGLTAQETHELVQSGETPLLFIDVRDPVEIQFTGFTDLVDVNIPFLLADRGRLNADGTGLLMERNPQFARDVARALEAKGLERDALIITMCRSGSNRGKPSAAFLREQGFANAKYVIHGFQGDVIREGEQEGFRLKNGWQNSGLPWSPAFNPEKISLDAGSSSRESLFVILTSGSAETQAMALILARATLQRGREVRLLLCDAAGMLAVKDSEEGNTIIQPAGQHPRAMLASLVEAGATVEVCGIFVPTRGLSQADLLPGIGVAAPPVISALLTDPYVKVLGM